MIGILGLKHGKLGGMRPEFKKKEAKSLLI
jgi:hypothetical protein